MKNLILNKYLYLFIKTSISLIFLWSGILKLMDPAVFQVTIEAFGILPVSITYPVSLILPVIEIILSVTLWFNIRGSLPLVFLLLFLFISILGYGIYLGLDIDCGCFGPEEPESKAFSGLHAALYRDLVMLTGLIYMFWYRLKPAYHNLTTHT